MLYLCCTCVCARPTVQAVAACSRCMPDGCSYGRLGCRALALHKCRSGSLQPEGQCARHACGSGRRSPCHYICCHAPVVINKQWAISEINRSLVQRSRHTTAASSFVLGYEPTGAIAIVTHRCASRLISTLRSLSLALRAPSSATSRASKLRDPHRHGQAHCVLQRLRQTNNLSIVGSLSHPAIACTDDIRRQDQLYSPARLQFSPHYRRGTVSHASTGSQHSCLHRSRAANPPGTSSVLLLCPQVLHGQRTHLRGIERLPEVY